MEQERRRLHMWISRLSYDFQSAIKRKSAKRGLSRRREYGRWFNLRELLSGAKLFENFQKLKIWLTLGVYFIPAPILFQGYTFQTGSKGILCQKYTLWSLLTFRDTPEGPKNGWHTQPHSTPWVEHLTAPPWMYQGVGRWKDEVFHFEWWGFCIRHPEAAGVLGFFTPECWKTYFS